VPKNAPPASEGPAGLEVDPMRQIINRAIG
jgi:hypothetical protein